MTHEQAIQTLLDVTKRYLVYLEARYDDPESDQYQDDGLFTKIAELQEAISEIELSQEMRNNSLPITN